MEDIKNEFDNVAIYKHLDNIYLRNLQHKSKEFLEYVENPLEKFKLEV